MKSRDVITINSLQHTKLHTGNRDGQARKSNRSSKAGKRRMSKLDKGALRMLEKRRSARTKRS